MKKGFVFLLLALLGSRPLSAQTIIAEEPTAFSLSAHGLGWKNFYAAGARLEYNRYHYGVTLDGLLSRNGVRRAADASEDRYQAILPSLNARLYSGQLGRGVYAEAGGGLLLAQLETRFDGSGAVKKNAVLPVATFGLGYRLGRNPKGIFGEVGLRGAFSLADEHLYTGEQRPTGRRGVQSTHSYRFRELSLLWQPSLSVGYSF
jgi:hypothetical protein